MAIGLSAGFIEPLEASALVLVERALATSRSAYPAIRRNCPP